MQKINLKSSLLICALLIFLGGIIQSGFTAEAAQTVNGKALGSVDDVVKEIGSRTKNFAQRFNNGYGRNSAANYYKGGTITNCRMNKILLQLFEQ